MVDHAKICGLWSIVRTAELAGVGKHALHYAIKVGTAPAPTHLFGLHARRYYTFDEAKAIAHLFK